MSRNSRISGCLFGLAFGDAYGAPTEFMSFDDILRQWPGDGPADLAGDPIRVTDDTQMTLAVGEALIAGKSTGSFTPRSLEKTFRKAFVQWLNSPDNNRAPGMTCLEACKNLEAGKAWVEATVKHSKGCGANMRVAPVGLLPAERDGVTDEVRAAIAQFQAALTHGHPTALAASDLTVRTITELLNHGDLHSLITRLREYALSQRGVYHEAWLGSLWERSGEESPERFIARGWNECLRVLDKLDAALTSLDYDSDPCLATGAGWVAEEAFATGLLCFLMYPDQPRRALQRAAVTSGDSDSIACLTGAFAGAHLGMDVWPEEWVRRIEYRERLEKLGNELGS